MQPCKYFQKGNCKFGIKCALAHITPDGKNLNSKPVQTSTSATKFSPIQTNVESQSFQQYQQQQYQQQQYQQQQKIISGTNPDPIFINNYTTLPQQAIQSPSQSYATNTAAAAVSSPSFSYTTPMVATSPFESLQMWNSNGNGHPVNGSFSSTNGGFPNSFTQQHQPPLQMQQMSSSLSFSNAFSQQQQIPSPQTRHSFSSASQIAFNSEFQQNQSHQTPLPHAKSQQYPSYSSSFRLHSSDSNNDSLDTEDTEDIDFIPSSLADLLTPQELNRRKSRSSFGSAFGTSQPPFNVTTIKEMDSVSDTPFLMD